MDNNTDDSEPTAHHHFYITPAILPQPTDTDTEWIQRVTMLADMGEQLAKHIYMFIKATAPIVLEDNQPTWHLLAGLGLTLRGIAASGRQQLAKRSLEPLDADDEQSRIIRDELAKPGIDPGLRDALLTILAHNLERPTKPPTIEDSEWPADGFTIDEE